MQESPGEDVAMVDPVEVTQGMEYTPPRRPRHSFKCFVLVATLCVEVRTLINNKLTLTKRQRQF